MPYWKEFDKHMNRDEGRFNKPQVVSAPPAKEGNSIDWSEDGAGKLPESCVRVLSPEAFEHFVDTCENPPPPSPKLVKLMNRAARPSLPSNS